MKEGAAIGGGEVALGEGVVGLMIGAAWTRVMARERRVMEVESFIISGGVYRRVCSGERRKDG